MCQLPYQRILLAVPIVWLSMGSYCLIVITAKDDYRRLRTAKHMLYQALLAYSVGPLIVAVAFIHRVLKLLLKVP